MALQRSESELSSHPHRPRVVLAAHLRRLGMSQKEAGKAVGRSERTVRRWEENKELQRQARAESLELWAAEMDDGAAICRPARGTSVPGGCPPRRGPPTGHRVPLKEEENYNRAHAREGGERRGKVW